MKQRDESGLRRRPAWLRALGDREPPATLTAGGVPYRRAAVYKHDAFACTCRYEAVAREHPTLIVKFCRTQSAFGVPFAWLGAHLRNKEARFYRALHDVDAVPALVADIETGKRACRHVLAHVFVDGEPLQPGVEIDGSFFPALFALIDTVHQRGIAVVDLNKIDNVIVDKLGKPHLLDFQLSVMGAAWWTWNPLGKAWLRSLQRSDRYHLAKQWRRLQPEAFAASGMDVEALRPASVRVWRKVWRPVILLRRRMFVALGVRRNRGTADTELTPEAAMHAATGNHRNDDTRTNPTSPATGETLQRTTQQALST